MRRSICVLFLLCLAAPLYALHGKKTVQTLPLTTSSDKARELYNKGITDFENLYLERCNDDWRAAVKEDPNLALGWAWIAFNSRDPEEVGAARAKAKALAAKTAPGEQLMIGWISNVQEGNFLAGISAMNDMVEMYPKDKHVIYLAGNWLMLENGNDQAERLMERALRLDKNFPPALNDMAYLYARSRHFNKAFAAMEHYIAVLPKEPNPQDSYAEILRMAGKFDGALEHYRKALKIDPDFVSSQLGLGDTYALMGDEEKARVEYDKAIRFAHNEADRFDYGMQKAMTWVREGNFAEADKAFAEVAQNAHAKGFELQEAQAYRHMAEYASDGSVAMKHLEAAVDALGPRQISQSDHDEELSRILRIEVVRATQMGSQALADRTLHQLEALADSSRSRVIQSSYEGAAGAALMAQKQYADAVAHLEEDQDNPFSMQLLSQAYFETGQTDKRNEMEAKLRGTNVPTMEQALVVPAVRSKPPASM